MLETPSSSWISVRSLGTLAPGVLSFPVDRPDVNEGGRVGNSSIRTMRPDGSGDTRLPGAAHTGIIEWTPDGSAFAGSTTRGPDDQIFLADPATGERTTVILVTDIPEAHFVRSLAFSPDGGALVVCVSVEPGEATTRLYTMGLRGEDLTMVSDRPDCYADWS